MTARYGEQTYDASYPLKRTAARGRARARKSSRKRKPNSISQSQRSPAFTVAVVAGLVSSAGFVLIAVLAMLGG